MPDADLQDESLWDFEHAEDRMPVKDGRAVVSVSFGRQDFGRVAICAEESGMKTSEFIRKAALEKCDGALFLRSGALFSSPLGWIIYTSHVPSPETKGLWGIKNFSAEPPLLGITA